MNDGRTTDVPTFIFFLSILHYKSKKLRVWLGMGEAVDTVPSIPNKRLFVSPDGRTTTLAVPWVYYKLTYEPLRRRCLSIVNDGRTTDVPTFIFFLSILHYKSKKLRVWLGMGEVVDTVPSIPNKRLFVSPDGRTTTLAVPWVYYKLTYEPLAQVS